MTTYIVTFDENRIGRYRSVEPLEVTTEAEPSTVGHVDDVGEAILKYARKHLISRETDIEFMLSPTSGKGFGTVFAGMQVGASFKIAPKEES